MQINKILHTGLLCAVVFSTTLCGLHAQTSTASLAGRITSTSGESVPGVTVFLKAASLGVTTDSSGNYQLKGIRPGTQLIDISAVGYLKITETVSFRPGQKVVRDFIIQEESKQLTEVNVVGKNQTQQLKESGFNVNAIETKAFQNANTNLNQVLDQTSGIRVRQSGGLGSNMNFSINGLSGNAVKYFIDGVPIEAMGGVMTLNNIPVTLAKSVEVYKGVVPIDFGADAMGGVVNIVTNTGVKNFLDASYGTGSFNTHQAAISSQYSNNKTGFIVKANGFLNYSKNNYIMRDVEIYDASLKKYVPQDHRRFHDKYFSALGMVEAGFVNKKWADLFLIGGSYSKQNNDIQTGTTQNILYGGAERQAEAYNASIKYKKDNFLVRNLNVNLFASLSKNNFSIIDTTYRQYFWDGSYNVTNRAEISGGSRSIKHYSRPTNTARVNLNYKFSDTHAFSLNYQLSDFSNKVYDDLNTDPPTKDYITKHIVGFAYQQALIHNKLSNTLFTKYYGIKLKTALNVNNSYYSSTMVGGISNANGVQSNWGYGIASRFKLTENTGLKASYEYTYRLQEPDELLGNGYTVMPNFNLKPESSSNYNLGFYVGNANPKHRVFFEGSGFIREAKNYIQPFFREALGITQYQNTASVTIKGIEGEARYAYEQLVNVSLNASYQSAINKTITDGNKEITYGFQLPNRPWFFGNASASIGKNNLLGKGTRLQFGWSFQYIHWFYLTWSDFGDPTSKSVIPNQSIHNLLLSYSFKDSKYNVSFECRNPTNALAYDNFKLQKPGRSFFIKLRLFLRK